MANDKVKEAAEIEFATWWEEQGGVSPPAISKIQHMAKTCSETEARAKYLREELEEAKRALDLFHSSRRAWLTARKLI